MRNKNDLTSFSPLKAQTSPYGEMQEYFKIKLRPVNKVENQTETKNN